MLKLHGKVEIQVDQIGNRKSEKRLHLLSTNDLLPMVLRKDRTFLVKNKNLPVPEGFRHYLVFNSLDFNSITNATLLSQEYDYLSDGDIIKLNFDKSSIRVLYRKQSKHNSFLVTERCNHYCLMCSQPPKDIDDGWIIDEEIREAIPLIDRNTQSIGFSGGEPTLLGDQLLDVLQMMKNYLPRTSVHILSNGRKFSDIEYARRYASINHPDMMIGIPIYSDNPAVHNYIVQAEGAFHETVQGVLNLKKLKQKVEIRIVLHKQSIPTLVSLCHYIARNLVFVDHVALMGLEMTGFTRLNIEDLWIDPYDYKNTLSEAVGILSYHGITTSVYNHQLCLINNDTEKYCVKSISDWKNEYVPECDGCLKQNQCGGFFSSCVKYGYSKFIKPFN